MIEQIDNTGTAPKDLSCRTTFTRPSCKHRTGWIIFVPRWIVFRQRLFVCSDCGHWERR